MDVPRLLRKLEESGLPMGVFAGVPPQLKQLWIKQTKTIVQMEHKVPANHPCQKDAEFKKNIKVCKELLRELDVAEEDWYVEEHKPKIDQPTPERNIELAGAQMEELHIAQEMRQPINAASEMTPQKREKAKAQSPQKRVEVVKNPRPPPTPKGVVKGQHPPITPKTPKTPREAEMRTPRIVNTPKGTSSKSRDNTPTRLLRSAKATTKMLEFGGSMEKDTSQDRAERQREELRHEKAERIKRAREEREEAVRARRMQIEKERVARFEAKIREKSPVKPMVDQFKQRQRLQKPPYSPQVVVKKALLQDRHLPVFVTQATSESRSTPKRKSRRDEEMKTDAHEEPLVQKPPALEEPLMQDVKPQTETEEPTTCSDTRGSNHFVFDDPMSSKERTNSKVSNAPRSQEIDEADTRDSNHFVFDEPISSKERISSKVSNAQQSQKLDEEDALSTNEISKAQEETVKETAPAQVEAKVLVESSKPNQIIEEPTVDKDADYGIDDLHSADDTDDEENPRKEIPAWAKGSALIRAVRTQASLKYNIDEYFGAKQEVDLQSIFGPKRFKPRSSSAVWHSPIHRPRPGFSTLDSSVVAEQVDEE
ncbi:unnamed protein product, partial [Mesorhabditis belari]|uniref:Inner centromere protein ARK-binding domain-containing protein n=1 Tax=Mesorhabditis belari TaxID=2138241 RepID=A0AAF3FLV4_9BILA